MMQSRVSVAVQTEAAICTVARLDGVDALATHCLKSVIEGDEQRPPYEQRARQGLHRNARTQSSDSAFDRRISYGSRPCDSVFRLAARSQFHHRSVLCHRRSSSSSSSSIGMTASGLQEQEQLKVAIFSHRITVHVVSRRSGQLDGIVQRTAIVYVRAGAVKDVFIADRTVASPHTSKRFDGESRGWTDEARV